MSIEFPFDPFPDVNAQDFTKDNKKEVDEFKDITSRLRSFAGKANDMLDKFVKADEHWFYKAIMKLKK